MYSNTSPCTQAIGSGLARGYVTHIVSHLVTLDTQPISWAARLLILRVYRCWQRRLLTNAQWKLLLTGLLKLNARESLLHFCASDLKASGLWSCAKAHQEMFKHLSESIKGGRVKPSISTRQPLPAAATKSSNSGSFGHLSWQPEEQNNASGSSRSHFPLPPDISRESSLPRRPDSSRNAHTTKDGDDNNTLKMRQWGHGSSIVSDRTAMSVPSALLAEDILHTLVNCEGFTVSDGLVEALQICVRSPNMTLKEITFRILSSLSTALSKDQVALLPSAPLWGLLFKASKTDNSIIHSRFTQSLFGFLVALDGTQFNCRCKHGLQPFQTTHALFHCDVCRTNLPINAQVYGCRNCDYDVCKECFQQLSSPTQTVSSSTVADTGTSLSLLQQEDNQLLDVTLQATAKLTSPEATILRNSCICLPEAKIGIGFNSGSASGIARKKRPSKKERRLAKKSREYEDKKEFKRRASKQNDGVVLHVEDEVHGSGAFELTLKKPLSNITVGELQAAVRDQFRWICSPFELRLTLQPSNRRYRKGTRQRNRRSSASNSKGVKSVYAGADHSSSTTTTEDNTNNAGSSFNEPLQPLVMIDPTQSVSHYGLKMGSTITCRRVDRMVPLQFLRTKVCAAKFSNHDCTVGVGDSSSDEWQVIHLAKSIPASGTCYWEMIVDQCEVYSERISLCIGVCAVNKDDVFVKKQFPPRQLWVRCLPRNVRWYNAYALITGYVNECLM